MITHTATVINEQLRIVRKSGSLENSFFVGKGATHAIVQGDDEVSVFYRKGGVKIFTFGGSCITVNGECN